MRKLLAVLALAGAVGCGVPAAKTAPAPVTLASPLPPAEVTTRAAQQLAVAGFTPATASPGILTATIEKRDRGDWGPFVSCRIGPDAIGRVDATMTLTTRVVATPTANGSAVVVASDAVVRYGPNSLMAKIGPGASLTSSDDCASTGEIEKRLAAALTTP
jgi:hypothetical protein